MTVFDYKSSVDSKSKVFPLLVYDIHFVLYSSGQVGPPYLSLNSQSITRPSIVKHRIALHALLSFRFPFPYKRIKCFYFHFLCTRSGERGTERRAIKADATAPGPAESLNIRLGRRRISVRKLLDKTRLLLQFRRVDVFSCNVTIAILCMYTKIVFNRNDVKTHNFCFLSSSYKTR